MLLLYHTFSLPSAKTEFRVVEDGYVDGKAHLVLYYYFNNASGVGDEHDSVF